MFNIKKINLLSAIAALTLCNGVQAADAPLMINPEQLQWTDVKTLPPGAKVSIIIGDPTKKQPFLARLKLPANYKVPMHSHPVNEYDTVITGALLLGMGGKEGENVTTLPAGSFIAIPAKSQHYVMTKEETILQISGTGPWGMIYQDKKLNA